MRKFITSVEKALMTFLNRFRFNLKTKLLLIFIAVKVIPLVLLAFIAWSQLGQMGESLNRLATDEAVEALNASAVENIERLTTDTANKLAEFLYDRDTDILHIAYVARLCYGDAERIADAFASFAESRSGRLVKPSTYALSADGTEWIRAENADVYDIGKPLDAEGNTQIPLGDTIGGSTNPENEQLRDGSTFNPRAATYLQYERAPLYDEITFIGLDGRELVKVSTTDCETSRKDRYKDFFVTGDLKDVSDKANTFIKAESYWPALEKLGTDGDIYVSDVIGAYVGTNFIGSYLPGKIAEASETRGYDIAFEPEAQSYAGLENPNGIRFEGIVRWAAPVYDGGEKIGYVTLALDYDHIMEFVDHITPTGERYVETPSAAEGNYAFIWDYQCRSIAHPRHNSIAGFDPETGLPQIPWLTVTEFNTLLNSMGYTADDIAQMTPEERVAALKSGWAELLNYPLDGEPVYNLIDALPTFYNQARTSPEGNDPDHTIAPELTRYGYVGLDGRYLNNAPQCTGWLDLTRRGGSGSLYILWSGVWKLNTAAAIPYYTGRYAPSAENNWSRVGFGFVAVGAGLEDFTAPAQATKLKLDEEVGDALFLSLLHLGLLTLGLIVLVIFIAVWLAAYLTGNINRLIDGLRAFHSGKRHYRFETNGTDEFGTLASAFNEMADGIVNSVETPLSIIDSKLRVIYMNEYGLGIANKTLDEVIGADYRRVSAYPAGTRYDPIAALLGGYEPEIIYIERTGRYLKGSASFFTNEKGQEDGYIITSTDVTDLLKARDAAERANKAKSNFLAKMSHEIRTPMNAVIGMSELALRENLTPKVKEFLTGIRQAGLNLLSLINDILDFSKIESGQMELVEAPYMVSSLINDVISIVRIRLIEKPVLFVADIDCSIPHDLGGDMARVRQILLNLLNNAVKYTDAGYIALRAQRLPDDDAEGTLLRFEIEDSGKGIKEEDITKLFAEFTQVDQGNNRGIEGTGLGLTITKNLCREMGGDVTVTSVYGKGSTFTAVVRQKVISDEPLAAVTEPAKHNVLIYEPRDVYARSVEYTLGMLNVKCSRVSGNSEFLDMLTHGRFDFVLVSSFLYDNARRFIDLHGGGATLVLMAEYGEKQLPEDVEFVEMPFLPHTIANLLNGGESVSHFDTNAPEATRFIAPDAKVLIVDDINTNLIIAGGLMIPYQMEIQTCSSGKEAVRLASEHNFDIIFMDHMMPEMDGVEATAKIRGNGFTNPIIALTANTIRGVEEMFIKAGLNALLAKPIDTVKLRGVLEKYLPKEKQLKISASEYEKMRGEKGAGADDKLPELAGINVVKGLQLSGGELPFYKKVIASFAEDTKIYAETIRGCLESRDIKLFTTSVHALKSAGANIGADDLSAAALVLETAGKENDTDAIEAGVPGFLLELEAVGKAIDAYLAEDSNSSEAATLDAESEDTEFLTAQLKIIADAADIWDVDSVHIALNALNSKNWSAESSALLKKISDSVLVGDFEDAAELATARLAKTSG
ncbi:MAG: response regulator [Oscillospiraceae bacterium]|jgi:signal transduction histidine kinase/CheY-like chemotaxis protein/HPt (histidine-containing phosphotransfer) domain-containing protein/HAMP domain-containing protein|nr:response regulator [Oscillospiraceae bacterium]